MRYFLLFFLLSSVYAVSTLPVDQVVLDLPAEVNVSYHITDSPIADVHIYGEIHNLGDKSYVLYLMKEEEGVYRRLETLGVVKPNSRVEVNITLRITYSDETYVPYHYLFLATDEKEEFHGKPIDFVIDWSEYEKSVDREILIAHNYLIPIGMLIILLVFFMLLYLSHKHRWFGEFPDEYSFKSLFFPRVRGRPIGERVADVFMTPIVWLIEILIILVLVFYMEEKVVDTFGYDMGTRLLVFGGVVAFLLPLLYFMIAWYLDMKPLRFFTSLFLWGGVAAVISFVINTWLSTNLTWLMFSQTLMIAVLIAPFIEESTKGLGLCMLMGHHEFDDRVSGLVFGFTVGVGFAFVENWFYIVSKTNPYQLGIMVWAQLILYRSFFNTLAHGIITGIGGAVIGYVKAHTNLKRFLYLSVPLSLLLVIPLHALFNISALMDSTRSPELVYGLPFLYNPMFVVLLTVIFVGIYATAPPKEVREEEETEHVIRLGERMLDERLFFRGDQNVNHEPIFFKG